MELRVANPRDVKDRDPDIALLLNSRREKPAVLLNPLREMPAACPTRMPLPGNPL